MGGQKSLVYGFGINDSSYPVRNGAALCPFYRVWHGMMRRVYSGDEPTYEGVSVCEEWHSFMTFRSWMMTQDWEGKELDKDIINPGNRVYASDNCAFVSRQINLLLLTRASSRGAYPVGVHRVKKTSRYIAQCSINGRRTHIGSYSTPEEASQVYRNFKARHIISIALTQENKVFKGLLRHAKILLEEVKND